MSDIRKWLKIMESVPSTLLNQNPKNAVIKQDATVMIAPSVGGGTGRYMHSTPQGAMIDIKGVARELAEDEFSLPNRDYEDPYDNGNTWSHSSEEQDTIGTMRDKPEFRPGDMVEIADVYGTTIGPGYGIFIAYSTSGQECIISFDNKEIVVPTANVGSVLEQNAKDNFSQVDNDGNLSPMSLGSDNVKIEKEPEMDQRDEFSKWMSAVEEALSGESKPLAEESEPECDCGSWSCTTCFPDHKSQEKEKGKDFAKNIESDKNDINADEFNEEEMEVDQTNKPKGGVKLGDIVQSTKTEFRKTGGQESPMSYGDENLGEQDFDEEVPSMEVDQPLYGEDEMDFDDSPEVQDDPNGYTGPDTQRNGGWDMGDNSDEYSDMISTINDMQQNGLSNAARAYSDEEMNNMSDDELKQVYDQVTGDVAEETDPVRPTKTKTHYLDDLDDILEPHRSGGQMATMGGSDDDENEIASGKPSMSLPAAGREVTQNKLRGMTPSDTMRDLMSRINPTVGADEPELPDTPQNELTVRTASDVPAVISTAMQASGMQTPEWHNVGDLPGFNDRNIRGMGRQVFGMFTSTPVEQIQTMANVDGQGPNTDAEMRAVAAWLRDNAEDLGKVDLSHGMAIPGYKPDVKEYSANGVRFHVVRDPMGQYIYAYPDKDARLGGPVGSGQSRIAGGRNTPVLGESTSAKMLKPTLFEQLKWDEEINAILKETMVDEEELDESSLSKMLGKEKGGQRLVQWLHRKHKLSNEADLQPQPFSERVLWKEFKSNPDNFVIVSATNGVAGVKPHEEFIKKRTEEFRKKGKEYNPAGDSTLPYQIIAFTDDGEQVDPALLRQPVAPGEQPEDRHPDPTVMRARMGKISGKDMQNPYNTFNLLADQIGSLKTVWVASGAIERDKMSKRADMKKGADFNEMAAVQKIFNRVRPVLKTLGMQALSQINNRAKRYIDGGNFEAATKISQSGNKLKQFLATIDTSGDVTLNHEWGNKMKSFSDQIMHAVASASNANPGNAEYEDFLMRAANGSAVELKPILDALRDSLVSLT